MSKNYMMEVAKMLGVELGEKFKVEFNDGSRSVEDYYFDENGLRDECEPNLIKIYIILKLLTGEIKIVKKPWKPKYDERYYYVGSCGKIGSYKFDRTGVDLALLYMGNCFRTVDDAEVHKDEILTKFKEAMER